MVVGPKGASGALPPLSLAANNIVTKAITTVMPGLQARQIHALLVAANLFWYQAIRQCMAVLVVSMQVEFGYSTKEKARLIMAPSVGNIITQLLGGFAEQWFGARATIAAAISGLAAGCTLLPMAASASHLFAFVLLAAQGFIFGPMFPSHSVVLSRWLTPSERGQAMAQGELAISFASMGVPLILAPIAASFGWRAGFYATGLTCFAYLGIWLALAASRPSECAYLTKTEEQLIKNGQKAEASVAPSGENFASPMKKSKGAAVGAAAGGAPAAPGWRILTHPSVVALFLVHMIYNLTTLSINSWMPTYYAETLKLAPESAKLHLTLPHLAALALKLCVSAIARALGHAGCSMLASRRLMCALGFGVTAVPLLLLPSVSDTSTHSVWLSTILFSIALAGTGFHAEGFRANYLDVTRAHVGLVSGLGNCLSSVAAMIAPLIVGSLVQLYNNQWGAVWYASSGACAAGALLFCTLSTVTPVEADITAAARKQTGVLTAAATAATTTVPKRRASSPAPAKGTSPAPAKRASSPAKRAASKKK